VSLVPYNLTILLLFVFENSFGPITFTPVGGSTKVQIWFLSKFSNSSCMALTQLESERGYAIYRGSNKEIKSVLVKQERCADLEDRITLSFKLPMIY
jgi:hypothetical protein